MSDKYLETLTTSVAAINAFVDVVAGTLGPKGLDVMIVDKYGELITTSDGATIVEHLQVKHPVVKYLVSAAKAQERNFGDGTTSVLVILNKLLSLSLMSLKTTTQPNQFVAGIQAAIKQTKNLLNDMTSLKISDLKDEALVELVTVSARGNKKYALDLLKLAHSLNLSYGKDYIENNYDFNDYIFKSYQYEGLTEALIINKRPHYKFYDNYDKHKCLVLDGPLDVALLGGDALKTEIGAEQTLKAEQELMLVIDKLKQAEVRSIFLSGSLSSKLEERLIEAEIFCLSNLTSRTVADLRLVSGAKSLSRNQIFKTDKLLEFTGEVLALKVDYDEAKTYIKGVKPFYSYLIKIADQALFEEQVRILMDAFLCLKNTFNGSVVLGAGVAELNIIESLQTIKPAKEQSEAFQAGYQTFSLSLDAIFEQIINNAGLDKAAALAKLSVGVANELGIDLNTGEVINLKKAGIYDSLEMKISQLEIIDKVASQVLKIGRILNSAREF
jgi:chaperonin GroEL (HSP60 family)